MRLRSHDTNDTRHRRVLAKGLAAGLMLAAVPAAAAPGDGVYAARCAVCHQPNGAGIAGQFPRLAGRVGKIAASPEGRHYLALVVINGMYGSISVDGRPLNGLMPAMGTSSDQALADTLNHLARLPAAPKKHVAFTAAEIAAARAEGRKSAVELTSERQRLLDKGLVP